MKPLLIALALFPLFALSSAAHADDEVKVNIFSAPWCLDGDKVLAGLQDLIGDRLADVRDQFEVRVYVETGDSPRQSPTQADADTYAKRLHLEFTPIPDAWPWKTYGKYFGQMSLPAAVIVDTDGSVLQQFGTGDLTAEAIVQTLESRLSDDGPG